MMKTTIGRFSVAFVLAVAAWACWREARLVAHVAEAKHRLATLRLAVDEVLVPKATLSDYLPAMGRPLSADIVQHQASVKYWLSRYAEVMDIGRDDVDPAVLLLAANAAFRSSRRDGGSGPAAVQQLDGVIQAYAAVLKASWPPMKGDPTTNLDAAYNFEFVSRVRDQLASLPPPKPGKGEPPHAAPPIIPAPRDLPLGPTVHGRPGAPPPDVKAEDFEILAPMEFGDREAQPEATPGGKLPRKG
ncbi:MAG: hypothetical protein ABI665_01795 [Vicinamibacterales bacterium]